jgi:hypothetical protein
MLVEEQNKLNQIKQLSDSILAFVRESSKNPLSEEKLATIADIEKKRQSLIASFFSHPVQESDSEEVATIIKQVLKINDQVTLILEKNKLQLTKEFTQFKTSKKATAAYLKHSL